MSSRVTKDDQNRVRDELRKKIFQPIEDRFDRRMFELAKEYTEEINKQHGFVINPKLMQYYNRARNIEIKINSNKICTIASEWKIIIPSVSCGNYYTDLNIIGKEWIVRFKQEVTEYETKKDEYQSFENKLQSLLVAFYGKSVKKLIEVCPELTSYFPPDPSSNLPMVPVDDIRSMLAQGLKGE